MCDDEAQEPKQKDARSIEEKVAAWVADSGRSIEMAVAHTAREAGALAIQSVPYVDPVTGKDRETDVVAEFEAAAGPNCAVTLVIECKRAPGKHWVTFPYDSGRISSTAVRHHALIAPDDLQRAGRLERAWEGGPTIFGRDPAIGSGLTEAVIGSKVEDDRDNGGDRAAKALWQVWSAARALLINETLTSLLETEEGAPVTRIIVPVIVTGAQLWESRLDNQGNPVVIQVDYARVRTPSTGNAVLVHVMTPKRFLTFARHLAELQRRDDPAWGPGGAARRSPRQRA